MQARGRVDHHQRPRPGRRLLLGGAQGEREARREAARARARKSCPTSSVARRWASTSSAVAVRPGVERQLRRTRRSRSPARSVSGSPTTSSRERRGWCRRGARRVHPVRRHGDPGARGHPAAAARGRRGQRAARGRRGAAAVRVRAERRGGSGRAAAEVRQRAAVQRVAAGRRPPSSPPVSAR